MKINGLEYLKCNDVKQSIPDSLSELPESMKMFIRFFKSGDEKDIYQFTTYQTDQDKFENIRWESTDKTKPWIIEGDRLLRLNTIEELVIEFNQYKEKLEMWHLDDYLRIGNTHSEIILIKLNGSNKGGIFLSGDGTSSLNMEYYFAAENIFDLFHQIELTTDNENLEYKGLNPKTLNRSIHEKYWKN